MSDLQLLQALRASADFLYRHGIGDGAAAIDEAIDRLYPYKRTAAKQQWGKCKRCDGSGSRRLRKCRNCGGRGRVVVSMGDWHL